MPRAANASAEVIPFMPAPRRRPAASPARPPRLGQILLEDGSVSPGDLVTALALQAREEATLGEILIGQGFTDSDALYTALARQHRLRLVDLDHEPPDPLLLATADAPACLRLGFLPWRRAASGMVVATAWPEREPEIRAALDLGDAPILLVMASPDAIEQAVVARHDKRLARAAEARTPALESCRSLHLGRPGKALAAGLGCGAAVALAFAASEVLLVLFAWAVLALVLSSALKLTAALAVIGHRRRKARSPDFTSRRPPRGLRRLPKISLLLPLYREHDIATHLLTRLKRLSYPSELTDILLIVEDNDEVTRSALTRSRLPGNMRVITVPGHTIRTKPRALNYALDFARGSIVGVYDAEDAPAPDQLHRVVRRFAAVGPEVACLQGVLDFYNKRKNWLSRCFAIEYAGWFRVVLPGLQRLGLAIPLGGTTLFFRREALESLGGWDAHNVTEDADLGMRLARHGYRTEILDTVTEEEANARPWPWIKQRSRWLKGFALTWAVHMRAPRQLWRELGAWRFFGFQVLFLGTLTSFFLAPVMWSFSAVLFFGTSHPVPSLLPPSVNLALAAIFIGSEAINMTVGMIACAGPSHRFLRPWILSLPLYFPLASLASYKAAIELVRRPFFWDKTRHGQFGARDVQPLADHAAITAFSLVSAPRPHQASTGSRMPATDAS